MPAAKNFSGVSLQGSGPGGIMLEWDPGAKRDCRATVYRVNFLVTIRSGRVVTGIRPATAHISYGVPKHYPRLSLEASRVPSFDRGFFYPNPRDIPGTVSSQHWYIREPSRYCLRWLSRS